MIKKLFVSTIVAIIGVVNCSSQLIPDWKSLETDFTSPLLSADDLKTNTCIKRLLESHNTDAFLEMSAQNQSLEVRLIGFQGLLALDQRLGYEVGLSIVLTEDASNTLAMSGLYQRLANAPTNFPLKDTLNNAFKTSPINDISAATLIRILPYEALKNWFEDLRREPVIPTYEALVLGRLYGEYNREKKKPTEKMQKTLLKFAEIPGEPRLEFLLYGDEADTEYKKAMELTLGDQTLSKTKLRILTFQKFDYIKKFVDIARLKIAEDRLQMINAFLDEAEARTQ